MIDKAMAILGMGDALCTHHVHVVHTILHTRTLVLEIFMVASNSRLKETVKIKHLNS